MKVEEGRQIDFEEVKLTLCPEETDYDKEKKGETEQTHISLRNGRRETLEGGGATDAFFGQHC